MEHQNDIEIDLVELYYYLRRKFALILASIVLFTVLGFGVSTFAMDRQYTASTRMYVLNRSNEMSVVVSDIQISSYLLNDYKVLITGQNVTKEVVEMLDLPISPKSLESRIHVTAPDNTRVLQISVTYGDPVLAADIANCVREVAARQIEEIMDVDAVKLVYEADIPKGPSSPNIPLYTFLSFVLGTVLSVGALSVKFMMDDTIRTEEDVEQYLGLGTLGVIPLSKDFEISGKQLSGKSSVNSKK